MNNLKFSKLWGTFLAGAFVILSCIPSGMCHGQGLWVRTFKFEHDKYNRGYIVSLMDDESEVVAKVKFYEYSHTDLSQYGNEALFKDDPNFDEISSAIVDIDSMRKGIYKFGCLNYRKEYDENYTKIFDWLYNVENTENEDLSNQV